MKLIGRSKVSKISPKPYIIYPFIRLPKDYGDVIGQTVGIYETEHEGKRAFMLVMGDDTIIPTKVIQPSETKELEKRVIELENDIKEIKQFFVVKYQQNDTEISGRPGRNSNPSRLRDRQT